MAVVVDSDVMRYRHYEQLLGEATGRFRPRLHRRNILDRTGHKAPTRAEWDVIPPVGVLDTWIDQLEAEEVDPPE